MMRRVDLLRRTFAKFADLIALLLLVFTLPVAPGYAGDAPAVHPSAQKIIDRAVARAEAQYESGTEAMFESRVLSSVKSLDDNGDVTKTESTRQLQYPVRGALFAEVIEKDGQPLSDKEIRDEEKRKQKFAREVEKRIEDGQHPQPEGEVDVRFNEELVSRYSFQLKGSEMVRGHRCWMITFEPREGELPVLNRMDRALNQSTGTFWIAQDDYGLARLEFALRKPFKYWGGFLALIRNTDGRLDFTRVEPEIWLPLSFDLTLDLKVMMIKDIRRRIITQWTDYKRSSGVAARWLNNLRPACEVLANCSEPVQLPYLTALFDLFIPRSPFESNFGRCRVATSKPPKPVRPIHARARQLLRRSLHRERIESSTLPGNQVLWVW
jgi:hypothetical protein